MSTQELKAELKAALNECWRLIEDDRPWSARNYAEEAVGIIGAMQKEMVAGSTVDTQGTPQLHLKP